MKRTVPIVLDTLHLLALAVWLGGLLTLWLALMPAAFHTSGLTVREAETVVGDTLRRFTALAEMCGIVLAAAQFAMRRRYQAPRMAFVTDGARQLLTFGALLLAEVNLRVLLPQMDMARQQAHVAEFSHLHQTYGMIATLQAVILIAVAVLTAWLQSPRSTPVVPANAPAATPITPIMPVVAPASPVATGTARTPAAEPAKPGASPMRRSPRKR